MNNERRKEIKALISDLENAQSKAEDLRDQEQEYLDNMPENMQDGARGEAAQEALSNLEYAADAFEEIVGYLNEAMGQ